jgi:hypothetical protein
MSELAAKRSSFPGWKKLDWDQKLVMVVQALYALGFFSTPISLLFQTDINPYKIKFALETFGMGFLETIGVFLVCKGKWRGYMLLIIAQTFCAFVFSCDDWQYQVNTIFDFRLEISLGPANVGIHFFSFVFLIMLIIWYVDERDRGYVR